MKRCLRCAEKVQNAAQVCRYCNAQLPPASLGLGWPIILVGIGLMIFLRITSSLFGSTSAPSAAEQVAAADRKAQEAAKAAEKEREGPSPADVQIQAERNLKEKLRDPDSADIRNARVPAGAAYLCGEVNATNGFGGKTGYRRFIAGALSTMPVAMEGDNMTAGEFQDSWSKLCRRSS